MKFKIKTSSKILLFFLASVRIVISDLMKVKNKTSDKSLLLGESKLAVSAPLSKEPSQLKSPAIWINKSASQV